MSIEDLYNLDDKPTKVVYVKKSSKDYNVPSTSEIFDKLKLYQDLEPEIIRPLNFHIVHTIKKVAKPLQQYVKKVDTNSITRDDIVIGGSGAAYTQVKRARRPHDLDFETSTANMNNVKNKVIQILNKKYKNITTRQLEVGTDKTKVIQVLVKGRPVLDIKAHKGVGTILNVFYGDLYHEIMTKPPIKIGNIYYTRIGELFFRKGRILIDSYHKNKKLGKEIPERIEKDLKDFFIFTNSLSKTNKKTSRKSNKTKHNSLNIDYLFGKGFL